MTDLIEEYSAFVITAANAIAGAVNRELLIDTLIADLDARVLRLGNVEPFVTARTILHHARDVHSTDQLLSALNPSNF